MIPIIIFEILEIIKFAQKKRVRKKNEQRRFFAWRTRIVRGNNEKKDGRRIRGRDYNVGKRLLRVATRYSLKRLIL